MAFLRMDSQFVVFPTGTVPYICSPDSTFRNLSGSGSGGIYVFVIISYCQLLLVSLATRSLQSIEPKYTIQFDGAVEYWLVGLVEDPRGEL